MYRRWLTAVGLSMVLGLSASITAGATAATADNSTVGGSHRAKSTFAVIGDIPYGDAAVARFPANISQINHDPAVSWVAHLGDIKSGSSVCSDTYFNLIKQDFDTFTDPLVYTIGDNEWTDCHRANNGGYNPLERLAKVRQVFFPNADETLGEPVPVLSQGSVGYPENVRFVRNRVSFAAVHIVGSNNSMAPWTGKTAPTPEQAAEVLDRTAWDIQEISAAFAAARRQHLRAVVLMTQADMFDTTVTDPSVSDYYAFQPIVRATAREASHFAAPVYLFNGDSHVFNSDQPLGSGSKWLAFYGLTTPTPNLTRVTVDGSSNATNYLRVTISPRSEQVLSWVTIPYTAR